MTGYNPRYDDDNSLDEEDLVANQSNPGLYIISDLDLSTSNGVKTKGTGETTSILETTQTPKTETSSHPRSHLSSATITTATTTTTSAKTTEINNLEVESQRKKCSGSLSAPMLKPSILLLVNGNKDNDTIATTTSASADDGTTAATNNDDNANDVEMSDE
ncbi:hypothetical protein PNOK_0125600 [Pyrrhoderma noxium]|uniref:Uncharacterized protein n=1 Tax=Pyrrhoderma noxium TaxID=2282107 RepID=A0A286UX94_9AGAM|nr:hypothetical protein PNOK_0125600 [Pyrrhoderma noxium]